jgi:hypothetical protein
MKERSIVFNALMFTKLMFAIEKIDIDVCYFKCTQCCSFLISRYNLFQKINHRKMTKA